MGRLARVVAPGFPHHVTQRGNRQADVFVDDADRTTYKAMLHKYTRRHGLEIWAYCLMTNHIHLVAVPRDETSLAEALRDAHTAYAMRFNWRAGTGGHVWQGRFFSCVLDEAHLWAAARYVERNPVAAGLVESAESYPWSSAPAHCGLRSDPLLAPEFPPGGVIEDWSPWLAEPAAKGPVDTIRKRTHTGRPCGSEPFIDRLESLLGRELRPQKRGRRPTAT